MRRLLFSLCLALCMVAFTGCQEPQSKDSGAASTKTADTVTYDCGCGKEKTAPVGAPAPS